MKFDSALHTTTERVLLVVPDKSTARTLAKALNYGPQLSSALTARAAREAIEKAPDLIILDLNLPDETAEQLLEQVYHQYGEQLPVIVKVSRDQEPRAIECLSKGAADYLVEPVIDSVVRARIQVHLELKKQQAMMRQLATLDPLTGFANRRLFERAMNRYWALLGRHNKSLSMIAIKLGDAEEVSRRAGYKDAEQGILALSCVLNDTLHRASDLACRFDEHRFLVALPDTPLIDACKLAREIMDASLKACTGLTVSIGIAEASPAACPDPNILVDQAIQLASHARAGGINDVRL